MTSSSHKMTCEACRDALTDYVCGELDAVQTAEFRGHVAACSHCAEQLSRFERVMAETARIPLDIPSPRIREQVMVQAREALTRRSAERPAVVASDAPTAGLRGWLERLGHWAMAPQVAMATVLLLMVGIGFYALPFRETEPRAALEPTLESSDPEGAESAAATTAPMAEEDARKSRVVRPLEDREPPGEEARARASRSANRFAPKPAARSKDQRADAERKDAERKEDALAPDDAIGSSGLGRVAKKAASPSKLEGAQAKSLEESAAGQFAPPPAPVAQKGAASSYGGGGPAAQSAPIAPVADSLRAEPSVDRASAEPATAEPAAKSARAKPASSGAPAEFEAAPTGIEEGIQRMQSGDPSGAIRILRPLVSTGSESDRQKARLWLARSYRQTGDCASALPYYATLVARNDAASAVLSEAADCYARTGDETQAALLRSRLKGASPAKAKPVQ